MTTVHQAPYDVNARRAQFPILQQKIHGKPLIYLDNAASTQKPDVVIEKIKEYYLQDNANIHRGIHALSERATSAYEEARHIVQRFINAKDSKEIVFTRGTTESINLVASSYGRKNLSSGDEVLISEMEHHSNILPWQLICEEREAKLRVIPIDDKGELIMEEYLKLLNERTKIVAVTHTSNSLGTVNPVEEIIREAKKVGAVVLIDGAQSTPHAPIDVRQMDCDFFTFSGHKIYGPTGVGVLYGKYELLETMTPYQSGGGMITDVTFEKSQFQAPPERFEAGTPNMAGVIGLGKALEYVEEIGIENIAKYESDLLEFGFKELSKIDGLNWVGEASNRAGVLSFTLENHHPHDIAAILDLEGIAIRAGHHCTQPIMDHFKVPATIRASVGLYTTEADIVALASALEKAKSILA